MAVQRLAEVIDADQIRAEAQRVNFGVALATVALAIPWAIGFCIGRFWLGSKTAVAAFKVGFKAGLTPNPRRRVGPA